MIYKPSQSILKYRCTTGLNLLMAIFIVHAMLYIIIYVNTVEQIILKILDDYMF